MREPAFALDAEARRIVLRALQEGCKSAGWLLHAAHVRTDHVHAVVDAETTRKRALARLKGRCSYELGVAGYQHRRWARGGSVKELWTLRSVDDAVEYVVRGQGELLAAWENPNRWADASGAAGP